MASKLEEQKKTQNVSIQEIKNKHGNMIGYDAKESLMNHGIAVGAKIASTLQGSIYRGRLIKLKREVVIKRTDIRLHNNKMAILDDGTCVKVHENIIKELNIMRHILSLKKCHPGILKVYKFINDGKNYFTIIENGGISMFNHVKYIHGLVGQKKLTLKGFKEHVKIIFKQICDIVLFIHNSCNVCHMDISLENILIKNFDININGKITNHGVVHLCDFGLSEYFGESKQHYCKKFVGKMQYQSPELFSNKIFNAKLNDIWSLGVCLFMIQLGVQPLTKPSNDDPYCVNILNGYLHKMCLLNGKKDYISNNFIDILSCMLTHEKNRHFIEKIIQHKYFQ